VAGTGTGTGTVQGQVTNTSCGAVPPSGGCPSQPLAARLDAVDGGGHVAGSAQTGTDGRYTLVLNAGGYTLRVTPPLAITSCNSPGIAISSGHTDTVNIACTTPVP
jgi:hypothetical protein